jgi:hypothetical protein
VLRYLRPVGGSLAAISLATLGGYFVSAVTSGKSQPWWPYVLLLGLIAVGAILYLIGQLSARPPPLEPPTATAATEGDLTPSETPHVTPGPSLSLRRRSRSD